MRLLPRRKTLMMSAAVISSLRVLRMRPAGRAGSSPSAPRTSGMTATPVSNPERPRASLGKRRSESPMMRGVE
jgi:hypothetical protein